MHHIFHSRDLISEHIVAGWCVLLVSAVWPVRSVQAQPEVRLIRSIRYLVAADRIEEIGHEQ